MEYAIYVRKSSDESSGKQIQSIPDQIEKCVEFAQKQGLKIMQKPKDFSDFESEEDIIKEDNTADIYERRIFQNTRDLFIIKESKSAKKPNKRPQRKKLVKYIKNGKIKGLISYSPDRQARNMIEGGVIIELADEGLVNLKYKTFVFENNASGRMMLGFWFVFSKQYSDKLSEDIGRGNEQAVKKGKSLGDYKHGYRRRDEDGKYEPDPGNFELMKQAFYMKIHEKQSDEYIAQWLNDNGYQRTYKTSDRISKISAKSLGKIRKNPFCYGMYSSGDQMIDMRDPTNNPHYEPLITEEEYRELYERYEDKSTSPTPQKRKEKYADITPFDPGVVITEDGYSLSPYLANPKRFQKKLTKFRKEKKNATYADVVSSAQIRCKCGANQSKYKGLEITYDIIEGQLKKLFSQMIFSDENYQHYCKKFYENLQEKIKEKQEETKVLNLQLSRIKSQKAQYIEKNMGLLGGDNKEEEKIYQRRKAEFETQITTIQQKINTLNDSERDAEMEFELYLRLIKKTPQLFEKANYVQKAKITSILVSNIIVNAEKQVTICIKPGLEGLFSNLVKMRGVEPLSECHEHGCLPR